MAIREILLDVRKLKVRYGRVEAVHSLTLSVPTGSIIAIIGSNGAGKSSSLNALLGLLPSSGAVFFRGRDLADLTTERRVDYGLSLVPEGRELFATMSVEDNLRLGAFVRYRRKEKDVEKSLMEIYGRFPRLKERRSQIAATLSGGERQMLAIGRALMARPSLLLLDEPSLGLAPKIVSQLFFTISELRSEGMTVLLVEQNARAALSLSDYAYVMETGEVILEGASKDLVSDPRIVESYLGKRDKFETRV